MLTEVSSSRIVKGLSGLLAAAALSILTGPAAATVVYYSLFNLEGESSLSTAFVTYATLGDMLNDENRTGAFAADGNAPFGANIVGTGADGTNFWNLFNLEGESGLSAAFVTYASFTDMLNDENRTGAFTADGNAPFGANIVGTGSDGTTYWNLFNLEGESSLSAAFVTYASFTDMLNDENRTGSFTADGNAPFGANIVGTGAFVVADTPHSVPLPATSWLVALGLCVMAATRAASSCSNGSPTALHTPLTPIPHATPRKDHHLEGRQRIRLHHAQRQWRAGLSSRQQPRQPAAPAEG